jgi:hypothetical protein
VPAKSGVQFGIRFRVVGAPDGATVDVRRRWIFPPAGLKAPAAKEPVFGVERDDTVTIGQERFQSYGFDDPWELVPGQWTIEYWIGNRQLVSKSFTVVKQ